MLFARKTPRDKRADLRAALASGRLLQMPGAFSPLVALMVQEHGFDGIYVSGAALSADLGLPDIGLTTLSEVALRGRQIARVSDLPALIDIDTGFGEAMNVARTVQEIEAAGLAGCHIEDQVSPKRCGHLDNKMLIPTGEMVRKIRAAIDARRDANFLVMARTDSRTSEGVSAAIERSRAYVDAGADAIFPEALTTHAEYETFRAAFDVPLLANLTEFGKTPLLTRDALAALGYNIAIYPVTTLRLAMFGVAQGLETLAAEGTQASLLERMQTRKELYGVVRYADYGRFDQNLYNFEV